MPPRYLPDFLEELKIGRQQGMEAAMITIYSWTLGSTEISGGGTKQSARDRVTYTVHMAISISLSIDHGQQIAPVWLLALSVAAG